MAKKLVAYFSAEGATARVAKVIAEKAGADLYEIIPEEPYTKADLNWKDMTSRSSRERNLPKLRPAIAHPLEDISLYDTIYLGFPVWWYVEPAIIRTFLEAYNFTHKKIYVFCTSGGSGFGKIIENVENMLPRSAEIVNYRMLNFVSDEEIGDWVEATKVE